MSRTVKSEGRKISPIKKYYQYNGSTGVISHYEKETKENVPVESLEFTLLDLRVSVTGFHKTHLVQISSNLICAAEILTEPLKVVYYQNKGAVTIAEGLYRDIKAEVSAVDGRYTMNIICLVGTGVEICNLQLKGASLGSWINLFNTLGQEEVYSKVFQVKRGILSQKSKDGGIIPVTKEEEVDLMKKLELNPRAKQPIWFYLLDFKHVGLTPQQIVIAKAKDVEVQKFFSAVKETPVIETERPRYETESTSIETEKPRYETESTRIETERPRYATETPIETEEDLPF